MAFLSNLMLKCFICQGLGIQFSIYFNYNIIIFFKQIRLSLRLRESAYFNKTM